MHKYSHVSFFVHATKALASPLPSPPTPLPTPVRADVPPSTPSILARSASAAGLDEEAQEPEGEGGESEGSQELEDDVSHDEGLGAGTYNIPSLGDKTAPKPKAGHPELSQSAIASRMRRVFTPTLKGKLKVSEEIMKDWESGAKSKKRRQLEQIFAMCGYDPAT